MSEKKPFDPLSLLRRLIDPTRLWSLGERDERPELNENQDITRIRKLYE